jgi:hypothetical protein
MSPTFEGAVVTYCSPSAWAGRGVKSAGVLRSSEQEEMARLLQELEVFPKMNQRSCGRGTGKGQEWTGLLGAVSQQQCRPFGDSAHSLQLSQRLRAGLN